MHHAPPSVLPRLLLAIICCCAAARAAEPFAATAWRGFGGADGFHSQFSTYDLTTAVNHAGDLVVGGAMRMVGSQRMPGVARWDGTAWNSLGAGIDGPVYALASVGGMLYAGGNAVSRWDGSAWTTLGGPDDFPSSVSAIASDGVRVYAGTVNHGLRVWNGSAWSSMAITSSEGNPAVQALCWSGGALYAGGSFTHAGGVPAKNIARWNGSAWSSVGGANDTVRAITAWNGRIIATGRFSRIGGADVIGIASYPGTGTTWSRLGGGISHDSSCLLGRATDLLVGGNGGVERWNGATWSALGTPETAPSGTRSNVAGLAEAGGALFASEAFAQQAHPGVVRRWDGSAWNRITPSGFCDGSISGVAIDGTTLLVEGRFTRIGAAAGQAAAAWNPASGWSGLPGSPSVFGSAMIAGAGERYRDSGSTVSRWTGTAWQGLGQVGNRNDWAVDDDGSLVVAGAFTQAGGVAAAGLARHDGSSWSAIGGGVTGTPCAVAIADGKLYVGGSLTRAGAVEVVNLAVWDGSAWSGLPPGGPTEEVTCLAAGGGRLYAATQWTLYAWNGTAWSSTSRPGVKRLAMHGDRVFVLGSYQLTLWDGSVFANVLGGGGIYVDGYLDGMAVGPSYLAVCGRFQFIGDLPAPHIAILDLDGDAGRPAAPIDSDPAADRIGTLATIGSRVGIQPHAVDPDHTPAELSLDDDAGGRFAVGASGGIVVAGPLGPPGSYTITVRAADGHGAGGAADFTILVDEPPSAPSDADPAAQAAIGIPVGSPVGITASSTDADGTAPTYVLIDDGAGRFAIDAATGIVTSTVELPRGAYEIRVAAEDGLRQSPASTFTVFVNTPPGVVVDHDPAANRVRSTAAIGTPVGITAFCADPDGTITYALLDDADGRFRIDPVDGTIVVDAPLGTGGDFDLTVSASDGLQSASSTFTITITGNPATGGSGGSKGGGGGGGGCGAGGAAGLIIILGILGLRRHPRAA